MGFYYGPSEPPPEDKPPGCLDALIITRAVFAIIMPVAIAIVVLVIDVAAIFALFAVHPALALIPIALTAVGIWWLARWDQQRHRPPGL
jgi:hypothetical protein